MGAGQQIHQGPHSDRLAPYVRAGYLGTYVLRFRACHRAEELPTCVPNVTAGAQAVGDWLEACNAKTLSFRQRLRHYELRPFNLDNSHHQSVALKLSGGKTNCVQGVPSSPRVKLGSYELALNTAIRTDRLTSGRSTYETSAALPSAEGHD